MGGEASYVLGAWRGVDRWRRIWHHGYDCCEGRSRMHMTHIIIDDFLPEPERVRQAALSLTYPPRPERASYPGRNAATALNLDGIEQLVGQIVHERVAPAPQSSHAVPRLALDGDGSRASVHIDFNHWSAMIFLTRPEHCVGGTHFFRHRATGWDRAPVFPGEAEAKGFKNADDAVRSILAADQQDRSKWEETMIAPMRYNRIVLFRGYMWHDAGVSFGDTPENGRLILPLFFENTEVG
ncbi:DUF6445 family protein [Maricaulis sp. W15]|uniref:DUF6445 family protein n=1 Tax=Maricaulis sp. W15 TaxID=1772333 RepID=UPI00117DC0CE|nr:DUF6445 family protein [Maricaulis sp. W15]